MANCRWIPLVLLWSLHACSTSGKPAVPAAPVEPQETGATGAPSNEPGETGEPSGTEETGTEPPVEVDEDGDGVGAEEDCDDTDPERGSRAADSDCDGVLNEHDQVEGDDAQLHGIGFQDPTTTRWQDYLGATVWGEHAEFVDDLDTESVASSRRYVLRFYTDLSWVTEVDGTSLDWRTDGDEGIRLLASMDEATFRAHVDQMAARLVASEVAWLADRPDGTASLDHSPMQIYAMDPEVPLWDRRWFYELGKVTFEMAYCAEMQQPWPYSNPDSFAYFDRTGPDDAPVYTPTTRWKILGEAHIHHLEAARDLIGHEMVSLYGGPWSVNYVDMSRAIHRAGLPADRLAAVVTDAMLRVVDMPLETGTMQRFIDTMGMNGADWYPPMHTTWERDDDRWGQVYFDALVAGMSAASRGASPHRPKGGFWLHTGRLDTVDNRVLGADARFTDRLWPDADPAIANFAITASALWLPDRSGSEQEGIEATFPLPGGVVHYMSAQLKAHQLYGFGFLPIATLQTDRVSVPGVIDGWNALVPDEPAWQRTEPLTDLDADSHAWIASFFYRYLLSGLRRPDDG